MFHSSLYTAQNGTLQRSTRRFFGIRARCTFLGTNTSHLVSYLSAISSILWSNILATKTCALSCIRNCGSAECLAYHLWPKLDAEDRGGALSIPALMLVFSLAISEQVRLSWDLAGRVISHFRPHICAQKGPLWLNSAATSLYIVRPSSKAAVFHTTRSFLSVGRSNVLQGQSGVLPSESSSSPFARLGLESSRHTSVNTLA
ncbi:hypothetical protein MVEN_00110900 [Mycena venus]|uniref:Uncharacterized protein n=1 Tax=Mycena venus TaxID=2733690 RepID=A0A8H7DIF5_9AGAR|nr:hypothetical protein MVEN_00110900 [Mycena venus]